MGFALCQPNEDGHNRLVACGSTGLTEAQKRCAMVELELAAITFALENSQFYCLGAKDITVWTDHQALAELQNKHYDQTDNKRIVRLFEGICHYNVNIKYIPVPDNGLAYALSRNPPDTAEVSDIPEMIPYAAMIAKINQEERKNIRLSRDLLEMSEVGLHCPEYNEIINKIKVGVNIKELPSDHILHQFVRKKKKTGELVNTYDKLHTIDTGRGELVYLPGMPDQELWRQHTRGTFLQNHI